MISSKHLPGIINIVIITSGMEQIKSKVHHKEKESNEAKESELGEFILRVVIYL